MLIEVATHEGVKKIRVCDYCRTVCIPSGRFCSGHCARGYQESSAIREAQRRQAEANKQEGT